ncbi:MAG: hypothetical protein B6I38_05540 [Anaerolineaceae bacterium 4572_5.1]|nr:MAG: hypothetical protein B6I38_05540 [Anaerolineaceae bacterium 4572_5.1]
MISPTEEYNILLTVTLYTREDCHLCNQVEDDLKNTRTAWSELTSKKKGFSKNMAQRFP